MGRIASVTTQQNAQATPVTLASSIGYEPFGPLSALTYGNGLALAVAYDQDYQPSTRIVSGAATVQSLAYSFDAAGDLKTVNDNVDNTRNQAFSYDALYHLTQASGTYGAYAYAYDADGNRSSIALTGGSNNFSASYAYAANSNQLQTVTTGSNVRSLTYTADGNTLQDDLGTGAVFGYGYNNDNRLIQSALGGVTQASYTLNYLGQRAIKAAVQTGTTHFHDDRAGHLIAESDSTGSVLVEYVWLGDTPLAFVTPSGGIDFIHADHLGTPQKMTDANQNLVWDGGASDPFMMGSLPATPAMNLRLPGQYYDAETAHHYNYFRDYDPSLGRYVESDPIGLGGGANTYGYVQQNPLRYADPVGLFPNPGPPPQPPMPWDDCYPDSQPQNPPPDTSDPTPSDPTQIQPTQVADNNPPPPPAANDNPTACDEALAACNRWSVLNSTDTDSLIQNRTDCYEAYQLCSFKLNSGHISKGGDEVNFRRSGKVIFRPGYPPVFVPEPYVVPPPKSQ